MKNTVMMKPCTVLITAELTGTLKHSNKLKAISICLVFHTLDLSSSLNMNSSPLIRHDTELTTAVPTGTSKPLTLLLHISRLLISRATNS